MHPSSSNNHHEHSRVWRITKVVLKWLFSHVGLCVLVGAYCWGGAHLFIYIEKSGVDQQNQRAVNTSVDIERQRDQLARDLWAYKWSNNFEQTVERLINQYHENVTAMIGMSDEYIGVPMDPTKVKNGWLFASALLFTITIVTTIGYGNVTPITPLGQLTVIFYALIGVPLMLMFLANIGDAMATVFRLAYGRGCCYFCWKRRKANYELNKRRLREIKERGGYDAGARPEGTTEMELVDSMEDPDEEVINVPISLTLVVIATYVFIGAILFATWNNWSWVKGGYFSFVTLSTIGFGDLIPGWDEMGTTQGDIKMATSCAYIVFGLAVLSMSFNLMMEEMFSKFKWLGQKLGIIDDPNAANNKSSETDKKPLLIDSADRVIEIDPKYPIHYPNPNHNHHRQQQQEMPKSYDMQ